MTKTEVRQARKKDARALAELIYDMYKEEQASGKITNGLNNAQKIPVS